MLRAHWLGQLVAADLVVADSRRNWYKVAQLKPYFAAALYHANDKGQSEYKNEALDVAAQKLGREAVPLFEACFDTPQPEVHLRALQLWAGLKNVGDTGTISPKLRQLFSDEAPSCVARAVWLAADLNPESVEEDLWSLLSHK